MTVHTLDTSCRYCGEAHTWERCPKLAAIEYYPDQKLHRVEFKPDPVFEFELDDSEDDPEDE